MTLRLELPEDLQQALAAQAEATGSNVELVAITALRESLLRQRYKGTWLESDPELAAKLAPIHDAFEKSGMTEDEAVELFEEEKHAMRRCE